MKLAFWKLVSKYWYKLDGAELEEQSLNRLSRSEAFFAMGQEFFNDDMCIENVMRAI